MSETVLVVPLKKPPGGTGFSSGTFFIACWAAAAADCAVFSCVIVLFTVVTTFWAWFDVSLNVWVAAVAASPDQADWSDAFALLSVSMMLFNDVLTSL